MPTLSWLVRNVGPVGHYLQIPVPAAVKKFKTAET
jgi:hypothetical protein